MTSGSHDKKVRLWVASQEASTVAKSVDELFISYEKTMRVWGTLFIQQWTQLVYLPGDTRLECNGCDIEGAINLSDENRNLILSFKEDD